MKKHEEGYVMILVVVVILVLSIVSAALMSLGVTNMKSQVASVERMQDKYSAQGEVEKVVAVLSTETTVEYDLMEAEPEAVAEMEEGTEDNTGDTEQKREMKKAAVADWIKTVTQLSEATVEINEDQYSCIISLSRTAESGKTQIDCKLFLSGTVTDVSEAEIGNRVYEIKPAPVEYHSYEINTTSEGGDS